MTDHYEKGCVINPGIELEDERHDPPVVMFRGLFIEEEAGRPFAFDVRAIDFVELLEVFGVCAVRSVDGEEIEAIRAEPPLGVATPILGFRSPRTGKEWRLVKLVTLKAPPPEKLRLDDIPPLELCPHGTRKGLDSCPVCDGVDSPDEAWRLYIAYSRTACSAAVLAARQGRAAIALPWNEPFWRKLVEVLPACGYRRNARPLRRGGPPLQQLAEGAAAVADAAKETGK